MKLLPCLGNYDSYIGDFDCGYNTEIPREDCVCCGGKYDPRYEENKQPRKLSKFIIHTMQVNEKRLKEEFENRDKEDISKPFFKLKGEV